MWTISELFFLFLGSLLVINYLKVLWTWRSLPRGPLPLPLIGSLWKLKFQLHPERLTQLSRLYGKIYTVWLGDSPLVVLNGWRAVKDGFVSHSEELSGRPVASFLKDLMGGGGILMSNGHVWKQQRRFGLMTLRSLGLGKCGLESCIQDEAQYMVESFRAQKGAPFDPLNIITDTVANVISAVVFGHRFATDDVIYQELIKCNHGIVDIIGSAWVKVYDAFPWLVKHLPGPHQTAFSNMTYLRQFVAKEIQTHTENGSLEEPQDVIDYYLAQIEKSKAEADSTFDKENLISMVTDLFFAGTGSTATTLQWALLYMVAYPHIQEKVHEELDTVLDGSKLVRYEDRKRLPYTNAVVYEIQRYANISAVGIPRRCIKGFEIYTYSLKKDTMVLANLDSVLFDPQYWKTPDQFNPNNFLDENGNFLANEAFLPFSGGARVCIGEQLARYEIFIIFTTLMRSFRFHFPEEVTELAKHYGHIYTVWLGDIPLVVLNGCKAVKDGIVSHSEELSGRPVTGFLSDLLGGKGIVSSNGHMWKQHRRFGLRTLRNLGLGKCGLESRIQEEAFRLMESFKAKNGEPFDPSMMVIYAVANVISAVVFGHRFSFDDGIFQKLVKCSHDLLESIGSSWARLYDSFPWLMKHVPGPHREAFAIMEYIHQFTDNEIQMHKENGLLEEPQDVIDYYLAHISKTAGEKESTFDEDSLVILATDLFMAGIETTATSLQWALLYMVAYPDVQKKVRRELDAVLNGSAIYYEDRKRLHYTNAVIHEIQRYGNILAVDVARTCIRDVNVCGYSLRTNTMVLPNLDSVLYDSEYWDMPFHFNPHHFLDKDGKFCINEAFLPFSAGARVCLGEQLARYELFIIFTTLMRSFSFHLPKGVTEVNTKYVFKLTLQPHPYKICAIPR